MSTEAEFNYFDTTSQPAGTVKPWTKVDAGGASFGHRRVSRTVHDLRKESPSEFNTDVSGFGLQHWPAGEKDFVDDEAVRGAYYDDVEAVLRANCDALASNAGAGKDGANNKVHKVVIFDHTIRRRVPGAPRGPVQQVHVDQTPAAVVLINVWRPISHAASDHPLAVIDWRTTAPEDFVPVDLLYPKRADSVMDDDDRGKEQRPSETNTKDSTEGYEARGETMAVSESGNHKFYYVKDMVPDEVLLLKCYDSWGEGEPAGKGGLLCARRIRRLSTRLRPRMRSRGRVLRFGRWFSMRSEGDVAIRE